MWCKAPLNSYNTVDGRDPAPVDRWFFPFFTKFYTSQFLPSAVWNSRQRAHAFFSLTDPWIEIAVQRLADNHRHNYNPLGNIPGTSFIRWVLDWIAIFLQGWKFINVSLSLSLFLWIHYMYYIIISASVNIWTNLSSWIESGFVLVSLPVPSSVVLKTLDLDR